MAEFLKKWYPFLLFGLFAIGGMIFLFVSMRPKNTGAAARYLDGRDRMEIDGAEYALINDIEAKTYIGSEVSDAVRALHGEEKSKIVSGGIMTVAVIYKVEGDPDENYMIDASGRLYAKAEIADRERARLQDLSNFPVRKIVNSDKDMDGMKEIDPATYEQILAAEKDLTANVRITDEMVTESYGLRREIFAFTEDNRFFRASNELFLYENEVYVTVRYLPASEAEDGKAMLVGTKLPGDLQAEFRPLFP